MPHEKLRFNLLKRIESHTDDNEERGAAKEMGHLNGYLLRPYPQYEVRSDCYQGEKNGSRKINFIENTHYIIRRVLPGPDAGYKPAVFFQIIRDLNRIEPDGGVKKTEKNDHTAVNNHVGHLARRHPVLQPA